MPTTNEQSGQTLVTFASELTGQATTLASRLPFDILQQIFLIYVRCCHYDKNWKAARKPQWVDVSYVCRHWREAALEFKTLWSYISVGPKEWTDTLLTRSGEVPLRITINFSEADRLKAGVFMEQVVPHLERFEECTLCLPRSDSSTTLPLLSQRSGPLLRRLNIILTVSQYIWNNLPPEADILSENMYRWPPLDYTPFNNDSPALQELRLTNHPLTPWCQQSLSALKVLSLRDLFPSIRPTVMEVMSVLSGTPALERLELVNAIRGDQSTQDVEKVHLPRLNHLAVSGHLSRIVPLLSLLEIPPTTRVRVMARLRTLPDEKDYLPFGSFLSRVFSDFQLQSPPESGVWNALTILQSSQSMSIVLSAATHNCERRCSPFWPSVDCDYYCDAPLKIAIHWPLETNHYQDLMSTIFRHIPLTPIQKLRVVCGELPRWFWRDIIWYHQSLQNIEFSGVKFEQIVTSLGLPSPRPDDASTPPGERRSDDPRIIIPSLKYLGLESVTVDRHFFWCGSKRIMRPGNQVEQLCNGLVERLRQGHPLVRLSVGEFTLLTRGEISRLEEVVQEVCVDGRMEVLPDPEDMPTM